MTDEHNELPREPEQPAVTEPSDESAENDPAGGESTDAGDAEVAKKESADKKEPSPLAAMRVRDVRRLLDEPENPLHDEARKVAQRAVQPFLDSQANWSKLLNSSAFDSIRQSTNLVTSKAVQDIIKSTASRIDPGIWPAAAPDTSKLIASGQPSVELGEQFAKIASQLAIIQTPPLSWTPPKPTNAGGTLYASAVDDDDEIETEDREPLDAADNLTLAEVADEAERQAEQDDKQYTVLLAIAAALSDLNTKAADEAKRLADAEKEAQARREATEKQDKKDRKRDGRRYAIPLIISLIALVLVAITLWATLNSRPAHSPVEQQPTEPNEIHPAPAQKETSSSARPSPTSADTTPSPNLPSSE